MLYLLLRIRLAEILIYVNKLYREYHGITEKRFDQELFYKVLDYIHGHLDEKITLDTLTEAFGIPAREASRLFHSAAGMSLGEYVIKCRVMLATDALAQGMRVEAVCEKVGFQNLSHFSRTFKKYMGLSPKQYAKSVLT